MTSGVNLFFDFIGWAREGLVEGTSSPYSDGLNVPLGRPAVGGRFAGSTLHRVRERASGIGAEVRLTAAPGIAVATSVTRPATGIHT
jgi:hypothetical protein